MSPVSVNQTAAPSSAKGQAGLNLPSIPDLTLLAAIDGCIQPVRVRTRYRLALLAITLTMLLLLLAYIALIGLIVVLIGLIYIKTGFTEFALHGTAAVMLLFFMPGLAGCFVIGFMLKPLFARYARPTPLILPESEHPELYAYVRRLCDILGARKPSYIQVDCRANASASLCEGRKGLGGGQLVLTIGLPLVAGLTLRQFTGVMAHEFGHFTQGIGMRLTFIVRTINFWFFCAVYERDAWDVLFESAARGGNPVFWVGAWIAKPLAGLTRCILWVLMRIGNLVSSAMLRQMEFDADRYEARVAGSDCFEQTSERIDALALAQMKAVDEISNSCRKGRLCDDFNLLVIEREITTSPEARFSDLKKRGLRKAATDWFDTHPCHKDRVASAKLENAPGIVRGDGPARALLRDFDAVSRRTSELYFRKDLGIHYDNSHVISTESMLADSDDHDADLQLLTRFFQGLINPICPVFPEVAAERPASSAGVTELLNAARRRMCDLAESARAALSQYDIADKRFIDALRSNALGRISFPDVAQQTDSDSVLDATSFSAAVTNGMTRINLALAAARRDQATPNDAVFGALLVLRRAAPEVELLRRNFVALDSALSLSQADNRSESIRLILEHAEKTQARLQYICSEFADATYPYGHVAGRMTLTQYAIGRLPAANEIGAVHTTSQAALKSLYTLYLRLLSDLARRTENLETALGLEPLLDPPENEILSAKLRSRYKF